MADKESQLRLRLTAQNEATPAFESVTQAMNSLKTDTSDTSSAISGLSRALDKAVSALGSLESTLGNSAKSFSDANEASAGLSKTIASDEKTISDLNATLSGLQRSMNDIQTSMRDTEKAASAMAETTATGANRLDDAINKGGLLIGLQQVGASMEHIGDLGKDLFKDAITQSADFEQSMSNIKAALVATGTPMDQANAIVDQMKAKALDLGSHYHRSATEIGGAFDTLVRQGVSAKDVLNGVGQAAIQVSLVTKQDLSGTANVISDVYNEFSDQFATNGKSMQQNMDDVANTTVGAMLKARISTDDYMNTLKTVGPVASSMHQSITDLATSVALLGEHGIKGSPAGTALKNLLLGLEPRTAKAAELMKELGISTKDGAADSFYQLNGNLKPLPDIIGILNDKFGDLNDHQKQAALSATFTKYGLSGLTTVVNEGKDKFNELKASLQGVSAEKAAGIMMDNLAGDMMLLRANTETLAKSFGDTLHPEMRKIAQAADHIVQRFEKLDPSTKKVIMTVLGVGSGLAIVGGAIVSFVSTLGFLKMGLKGLELSFSEVLGPVGLVTAAIALLAIGAYELWKHWDDIKKIANDVKDRFITLKNEGVDRLKTAVDDVKAAFKAFGDDIVKLKDNAVQAVKQKFDEFTSTINAHKTAIEVTASVLTVVFGPAIIKTGVEAAISGGKMAASFIAQIIRTGTVSIVVAAQIYGNIVASMIATGYQAVINGAKVTASFIASIVKTGAESVIAGAKLSASLISQVIRLGVETVVTAAKITTQMIVAIVSWTAEGWKAAASIAGQTAKLVVNTTSLVAQKVALVASEIATGALTAAQWLLNAAMDANPIGVVILAIAALGVAIVEVITHWQDIVTWVGNAWDELSKFKDKALDFGGDFVRDVAKGIEGAIDSVINAAKRVVSAIKSIFSSAPKSPSVNSSDDAVSQAASAAPKFATGGVVDKPTLAMVGEGGEREFIIPESKLADQGGGYSFGLPSMLPFGGGRGTGGMVLNIHPNAIVVNGAGKDGKQIGQDIMATVRRQFGFAL